MVNFTYQKQYVIHTKQEFDKANKDKINSESATLRGNEDTDGRNSGTYPVLQ